MPRDGHDDQRRSTEPPGRGTGRPAERRGPRPRGPEAERGAREAAPRLSAPRAMRYAASQLQELLGRAPESVSAVRPTDEGWQAEVEVLEVERIPETSSVMASYRVLLDPDGELLAYERIRRYTRAEVDRRG